MGGLLNPGSRICAKSINNHPYFVSGVQSTTTVSGSSSATIVGTMAS
jgi:hypothetical protein